MNLIIKEKELKQFYPKHDVELAIRWFYNCTVNEAKEIYKWANIANRNSLTYWYKYLGVPRYKMNPTKGFTELFKEGSSI